CSPWRPAGVLGPLRSCTRRRAAEIVAYGRFVALAGVVSFLVVNVDDAVVVRQVGVEGLGLYARAYLLANLPVTALTHVVSRVAFAAYARLREQAEQVQRLYLRLARAVMLLAAPAALGLVLLARPLSVGVFGPRWEGLVPLLPWLGVYGAARAFLSGTGPLFNALGSPQSILHVNLVQLPLLLAGLAWLVPWRGAEGACMAVLAAILLSAPLALRRVEQASGLGPAALLAALRPLAVPAASMAAALLAARAAWALGVGGYPLAEALVSGTAGTAAYAAVLWRRQRLLLVDAVDLLRGRGAP
ncbi:MAG: oligosaccharide flippase family protein, partial [Candidatus Latescibacterota bacterium]